MIGRNNITQDMVEGFNKILMIEDESIIRLKMKDDTVYIKYVDDKFLEDQSPLVTKEFYTKLQITIECEVY